jgi:hypothetical protein
MYFRKIAETQRKSTNYLLEPHFTVAAPGLAVSTHFLFLLDGGGFAEGFNLVVA